MKPSTRLALLSLLTMPLLGFSCVDFEVERPTYEIGEAGVLVLKNSSRLPMAIGGCNPTFYHERLAGRWVPDPFVRSACVFFSDPDGSHTLNGYSLIPPGGTFEVRFPTDWLEGTPGIMRVSQRVSVACTPNQPVDEPLECAGVEHVLTDPVVIFQPGTSDTFGRR